MALVLKDRVKQTAAAPGTGTITLSGSATGFQSFSVIGNGNTTYFAIYDPVSGDWEVNYGTYTSSGTTLTRNATPLSSSAGGSLVNFTGVVDVFVTYPSENAVWRDTAGVVVQQDFGAITATSAALTTGTISTAPVNNTDIVNKQYADAIASGIHFHEAVDLATTAALPANTYNNGTSGVGATLTANANGALSVDSTLTVATNRILVKNEVTQANNGVYTVTQVGSAGTPYILTRAADFDSAGTGVDQIDEGDFFLVTSGVVNLNTAWVQQTAPPIVVGTTALVFQQFAAPITYTAGTGLNESPTYTFNIATTGVSAATYGSASTSATIAVNAQGQITSASNTTIAINGTQVSGNIAGQAGSVANALTAGTYLTSGGTYDGSAARTFAVDATDANTASKVVARDSSGNFSAGTITATLSGAATSAGTATNIAGGAANQIPYQTGAATTSFVVAPTVAGTYLNWNGSSFAYTAISLPNNATFNNGGAGDASGTTFNGSAARTISYNTVGASPLAGSSSLTTTGTVTSGTWSASFGAVSGANLTSLTAGNLSGTIPSAVLGNSTAYIGTTAVALNRASANQALTGISSVTLPGATSGTAQITPNAVAGTGTVLTLPATTGTLALTSDLPTVNNATLTMNTSGTGLSGSQTFTANQATGATFTVASNATNANTASTIVARDASGNFSAGTITATLSGAATSATTAGTITSQANSATITATSANTASQIVLRDASGNFSAGTITATLSGSATSAGTATTAGGLTGTPNITVGTISTTGISATGDITTYRSGSPTTGVIYFGNSGARYLYYDGTNYAMPGANLYVNGIQAVTNSGTWGISITGNAATAPWSGITSKPSNIMYYQSFTLDANTMDSNSTGFTYSVNAPYTGPVVRISAGGSYDMWFNAPYSGGGTTLAFRTRNGDTATLNPWRTILCDSNYTSYAPSLTGSGASGTWSINVTGSSGSCTGNAATVSSITGNTGLMVNRLTPTSTVDGLTTTNYRSTLFGTTTNAAAIATARWDSTPAPLSGLGFYGTMLGWAASDTQGFLALNYNSAGAIIGGGNGNNINWTATLLQSSNYTSYAMPIGSSATNSVDVRAPIFYDSNDTAYYVNPNSQTFIYYTSVNVGNEAPGGANGSSLGLVLRGNYNSNTWAHKIHKYDNGGGVPAYMSYTSGSGAWTAAQGWGPGLTYTSVVFGSLGSDSLYSQIFYDTNNTTYYVDPAGSTALNINGGITFATANPYITASSYFVASGGAYFNSGTVYMEANLKARGGVGNDSAAALTLTGGTSGYTQINGSARSPLFYDSDNTGYYVDPASTSRMNTINADSLYSYGNVTAYSDERLKKDWETLPPNFVEELAKVKSGTYTRIDSGERQVGVGAQSLQAILKEAVSEKEEYLGVHYGNAAMVSAVELAKEVVDLRARVAQLESLISKLIGD